MNQATVIEEKIRESKYIYLINEIYDNNILLHEPLQLEISSIPTELFEILKVSDGIEEVMDIKDKKEFIGWIHDMEEYREIIKLLK